MHQVSNYFFLGFHWWPAATLKHGCHVIEYRNSVSKAVKPRWLLSDLLKISTNQLCRTHSKLPRARNILLPSCSSFCDFKKSPFQPMDSFAHTALCGGEVQRCRFWEPLLGFSLFFSMTSYLNHIIFLIFIHIYIRYHHIRSRSSICYTKEDRFFFSFLEGDSLFLTYLGNPTLHLVHLPLFLTITLHNGISKMHWCYLCLAQWCWFFPRVTPFLYIATLCSSQSPHSQTLAHSLFLIFCLQLITICDLTEFYALALGAFNLF